MTASLLMSLTSRRSTPWSRSQIWLAYLLSSTSRARTSSRSRKQVETERKLNHHLQFDDCESLDDVKAKVEDVDLFIPQIAEVVKQNAELAWTQTTPDHFRVSYSGEGFPEAIDLRQDMLGKWTVEFSSGFKKAQQIAKTQDSLPEAFAAAEKWMSVNRPRIYRNKSQKAGWRKARPSDAQVREIDPSGPESELAGDDVGRGV